MTLDFAVPGKVVPWERTRDGRRGRRIKPARTRAYQARVARCAQQTMAHRDMHALSKDVPVAVEIIAYFNRPRSVKWHKEPFPIHTTRGDDDNIQKTIKDALQGVAYANDKQIVDTHVALRYCDPRFPDMKPHVRIRVWEAGNRGYVA